MASSRSELVIVSLGVLQFSVIDLGGSSLAIASSITMLSALESVFISLLARQCVSWSGDNLHLGFERTGFVLLQPTDQTG